MPAEPSSGHYIALSGGVGGAKLALGLARLLQPEQLTIIANTGDDFEHMGLSICPDLDTVMYTLADLSNRELGWGLAGESWQFLDALEVYGGETWFKLGDRDLATHLMRTMMLSQGHTLSQVTERLSTNLGINPVLAPMSDQPVRTVVRTRTGDSLMFQHYFVRDRCEPAVTGFEFEGVREARPSPAFEAALSNPGLRAVVICPSNPFVSVDPVLQVPGVQNRILAAGVPLIAVSPIVSGLAIKGPAAKMMKELGMPQTATAVAAHYRSRYGDSFQGFVLDLQDAHLQPEVEALGVSAIVTNTVMVTLQDRVNLANAVTSFAQRLTAGSS